MAAWGRFFWRGEFYALRNRKLSIVGTLYMIVLAMLVLALLVRFVVGLVERRGLLWD
jgi:hypothetical protein